MNHPNIVTFYGGEKLSDNYYYIYLEYMEKNLLSTLKEYGPFDEETIKYYAKQILLALEYMHKKNIIHKDIKCSNIL